MNVPPPWHPAAPNYRPELDRYSPQFWDSYKPPKVELVKPIEIKPIKIEPVIPIRRLDDLRFR